MADDPYALRLAELVGLLSLGQDSAFGQPMESELRSCLLSVWIAESLGLDEAAISTTYYTALLRYVGCTGHAHEVARVFGDEIAARSRSLVYDMSNPGEVLAEVVRHAGGEGSLGSRLRVVASVLAMGKKGPEENFRTGCEVAAVLIDRLGLPPAVNDSIQCSFERWNGKGFPNGVKGDAIPLPMRIVHLAQEVEPFQRVSDTAATVELVRKRSGKAYDPAVADAFLRDAAEWFERLDKASPWTMVIESEPVPRVVLSGDALDDALRVLADFVDLKSPFTGGHSRAVGDLAAGGAEVLSLPAAEVRAARLSGYVHDLGRTAVPNSIWDKPRELTHAEWDRVHLHPLLTFQMLERAEGLAPLAMAASCHHERADGSGYFRAYPSSMMAMPARLLAAADTYHAMTEDRAYRPALSVDEAAARVRADAGAGLLDPDVVEAVLQAAGHRTAKQTKRSYPAGLTAREVEVLRLVAQGLTTKQVAERLVITAKTADHHIQHIYAKIGVSTRGAAALFAMQNELVTADG